MESWYKIHKILIAFTFRKIAILFYHDYHCQNLKNTYDLPTKHGPR